MHVGILGAIEVVGPQGPVTVRGAKRRGLLAYLLVHNGEVVPVHRLVDELWEGQPSPGAANTVRTYVSQLRKLLAAFEDLNLETAPGGYALTIPAEALDAVRFERLCARAMADADPAPRLAAIDEALGLWRGPPLEEFAGSAWADVEATRLEALHLQALDQRVDALLALGRHAEAIPELEQLVRDHRLDEHFWAQLMVAYYRAGRQGDALRAYQELRSALAEELGVAPGTETRDLEHLILDHDLSLAAPVREHPVAPAPRVPDSPPPVAVSSRRRLGRPSRLIAVAAGIAVLALIAGAAVMVAGRSGRLSAEAALAEVREFVASSETVEYAVEFEIEFPDVAGGIVEGGVRRDEAVFPNRGRSVVQVSGVVTETLYLDDDVYFRDAASHDALDDEAFWQFSTDRHGSHIADPEAFLLFRRPQDLGEALAQARGPSIIRRDDGQTALRVSFEEDVDDPGGFGRFRDARGELVAGPGGRLLAMSFAAEGEDSRMEMSVKFRHWDRQLTIDMPAGDDLDLTPAEIELTRLKVLDAEGNPFPEQTAGVLACPLEGWEPDFCPATLFALADANGDVRMTVDPSVGYRFTGQVTNLGWPCPHYVNPPNEFWFSDEIDAFPWELGRPTIFVVHEPDSAECPR